MGKVFVNAAVSLDGFVASDDDSVGPLFDYYGNGEVESTLGDPDRVFRVTGPTARYLREVAERVRAVVIGRRLFDLTNGWGGVPAAGEHVFVVTHEPPTAWPFPDAPFTFVPDGVAAAVESARAFAGDGDVAVAAGEIGGQALAAGVVDEVHLNLVPALLGSGKPFFGSAGAGRHLLENPRIIAGDRVVHLIYPVRSSRNL